MQIVSMTVLFLSKRSRTRGCQPSYDHGTTWFAFSHS
ncbi:hypothetical protein E2C01_055977 [Portunus trituberculatus]|uniref:Uncharacterized protein n=1 Tax=Portunus trituberculatus TaxID=210409 RepID=A0A5B7GNY8_PORTR|nr:hypothetical protein [Portunus trituberculatus]